ncbi:DEAD/DEAH box helicase [bacterium]|nr:DEAD/DEAH box helicase [bacterium]
MKKNNFLKLTPIQEVSFKTLNSRPFNAIIFAPTGTGKTLSYLLPVLNNIDYEQQELQCLVILPTHELS